MQPEMPARPLGASRHLAGAGHVLAHDGECNVAAHVVDVLAGRAEPQPSGQHNLETLAVTLAALPSARTGQTVTMAGFTEGSPE